MEITPSLHISGELPLHIISEHPVDNCIHGRRIEWLDANMHDECFACRDKGLFDLAHGFPEPLIEHRLASNIKPKSVQFYTILEDGGENICVALDQYRHWRIFEKRSCNHQSEICFIYASGVTNQISFVLKVIMDCSQCDFCVFAYRPQTCPRISMSRKRQRRSKSTPLCGWIGLSIVAYGAVLSHSA